MRGRVLVSLLPLKPLWGNRPQAQKLLKELFGGKNTSNFQFEGEAIHLTLQSSSSCCSSSEFFRVLVFKLCFCCERVREMENRWQNPQNKQENKTEIFLFESFASHNYYLSCGSALTAVSYAYVISKDPKQFTIDLTSLGSDSPAAEMQLPLEWKPAGVWDHTATVPDNLALQVSLSCGNHGEEFREAGRHFITEEECGR